MRRFLILFLSSLCSLCLCGESSAHPVPKNNHDRTVVVRLTPAALVVDYRLELDELTAINDLPRAELAKVTDRRQLYTTYLDFFAPAVADNLVAELDGKPLRLRCTARRFAVLDHFRCDYR